MRIKLSFAFIFVFIISTMVVLGWMIVYLSTAHRLIVENQTIRSATYAIGGDLRKNSEDLSYYCRMYVVTGDSVWETKYREVIKSKNNQFPKPHELLITLRDSLRTLGFSDHELDLFSSLEKSFGVLMDKNLVAINARKGNFVDSAGLFSIKGKPDLLYAQKMLSDGDYIHAEEQFRQDIDSFLSSVRKRSSSGLALYILKAFALFFIAFKLLLAGLIVLIIVYFVMRKNHKEQARARDALMKTNEELNRALIKAEESDRLKSAFLANMSHEIRTPMNGILGFAGLLKDRTLTGVEQQGYVNIIERSGVRMLNLINNIIDISRIESGAMKVSVNETNINQQIEDVYAFFKLEADRKGIQLKYTTALPHHRATIKTDQEKFYSVLSNLVKNALNYTKAGSIEFGYNLKSAAHVGEPSHLEFFVKDTGQGIAVDRQKPIFDRFIQADITDKDANQGSGLGLSISKAYVEMLGGKIWLESEQGKGSVFFFTIPYSHETLANSESKTADSAERKVRQSNKLKVLIVEDDEISSEVLTLMLKDFYSEALHANNGIDAVEACRANPDLDLILMDIAMPGINGYEAISQIRAFNTEVIIVAQTAFALEGDREKIMERGCNDYISKPIIKDTLLELIRRNFNI